MNLEERIANHHGFRGKITKIIESGSLQNISATILFTNLPIYAATCRGQENINDDLSLPLALSVLGGASCIAAKKYFYENNTAARVLGTVGFAGVGIAAGLCIFSEINYHSLFLGGFFASFADHFYATVGDEKIADTIKHRNLDLDGSIIRHKGWTYLGNHIQVGLEGFEAGDYHALQENIRLHLRKIVGRGFITGAIDDFHTRYLERKWQENKDVSYATKLLNCYSNSQDYVRSLELINSLMKDPKSKMLMQSTYFDRLYREAVHNPNEVKITGIINLLSRDPKRFVEESWRIAICSYLQNCVVSEVKGRKVMAFDDEDLGELFVGKQCDDEERDFSFRLEGEFWNNPLIAISAPLTRFEFEEEELDLYQRISGRTLESEDDFEILKEVFDVSRTIFRMDNDFEKVDYLLVARQRVEENLPGIDVDWNYLSSLIVEDFGIDKDCRGYNFLWSDIDGTKTLGIIDNLPKRQIASAYVSAKLFVETGIADKMSVDYLKLFYEDEWKKYETSHKAGIIVAALGFIGFDISIGDEDVMMQKRYCEAASYAAKSLSMSELSLSFDAHGVYCNLR